MNYFPFENIRPEQDEIINTIIDTFENTDIKTIIIEAGTGIGKSAIGMTISNYMIDKYNGNSYILTTQKILQDQYMNDFHDIEDLVSIRSSNNYICKTKKEFNCSDMYRINKDKLEEICNNCVYRKEKNTFVNKLKGVTNYSYFLSETIYAKQLKPRKLLILDEGHNISKEISGFIDIIIEVSFLKKYNLNIVFPKTNDMDILYKWVIDYIEVLVDKNNELKRIINNKMLIDTSIWRESIKTNELFDKILCKTRRFVKFYDKDNWVSNYNIQEEKIEIKPIDISIFVDELLYSYGEYKIIMSATILNFEQFCILNGLNIDECKCIYKSSPFEIENTPIYYQPCGSMSHSSIDITLPKMINKIKELIVFHNNDKGIIHCHSYKILKYIKDNIKDKRLLFSNMNNRDMILKLHMNSKTPTILVSPSMSEGVDLKDDMSRFQIICKVPFPYLNDDIMKKKMKKWDWYYSYCTAITMIQSCGRSVRNEDDYACTYIIDSSWEGFYKKNKYLFVNDEKFHIL
jgi:ATP-dependent DNA helicase DinG